MEDNLCCAGELGDLREEVAFWRRDAAARLWGACADHAAAKTDKERARIRVRHVMPTLAALREADSKEWHHDFCEHCGVAIKPGERYAQVGCVEDDGSIYLCAAHGYEKATSVMDGTPEDVARQIEDAKALLASVEAQP